MAPLTQPARPQRTASSPRVLPASILLRLHRCRAVCRDVPWPVHIHPKSPCRSALRTRTAASAM